VAIVVPDMVEVRPNNLSKEISTMTTEWYGRLPSSAAALVHMSASCCAAARV